MFDIEVKLKKVIGSVFGVDPQKLTAQSSQDTLDVWDSNAQINLILAIEEEFDVSFSDEEIEELLSFELIALSLKEKLI